MFTLGAFSFIAPVALLGLVTLPALWWLLRVIPPAPRRVRFPAIKLIMTLVNPEQSAAKSPLWLTLLRLALVTLVILGAAHPVLNADNRLVGEGTLVLIVDDGWTAAKIVTKAVHLEGSEQARNAITGRIKAVAINAGTVG